MLWWIGQNLAIAALLAGVVRLLCGVGRIGPVARHALWLVVLIKLLTPPLFVLDLPIPPGNATPEIAQGDDVTGSPHRGALPASRSAPADPPAGAPNPSYADRSGDAKRAASGSAKAPIAAGVALAPRAATPFARIGAGLGASRRWLPVAGSIWLAGAVLFAAVQGIRIARLLVTLRHARPADRALREEADALARRLGIRPIPILVVHGLASPSIWSVAGARLLWPAGLPAGMSDSSRQGLLLHELAHVKRRDHWVGWIELAAGCIWWWNPLFWYVRSQLRENAELACDGWVVQTLPHGRRAYAEALLAVCASLAPRPTPMPALGISTGSRRVLERRLVMIMRERIPLRLSWIGLSGVLMLMLATLPAWAQRNAAPARAAGAERPDLVPATALPRPAVPHVTTEVRVVAPQSSVPDDARKLLERYSELQAAAYREAEEKIERQRRDVIGKLQQIQDTHTRAGRLDEAIEVREIIRRLNRTAAAPASALGLVSTTTVRGGEGRIVPMAVAPRGPLTPFSLQSLRGHAGQTITLPVVGATEGTLWGNGVYTDDSSLAAAAVHAGLVAPGRLGFVRVTILPGQDHYEEATKNGVTGHAYGEWSGSFKVEREPNASPVIRLGDAGDPSGSLSLQSLRGQAGASLTVEIVGAASGESLWGTDEYTDDSSLALAAVHAGILRPGVRGLVKVTVLPGRESYAGSERNGVKSAPYTAWSGSFRVEPVAERPEQ